MTDVVKWSEKAAIRALANHFGWHRVVCCPNVMVSAYTEADLLILSRANYLYEVEIKISLSDWKADLKKERRYDVGWNPYRFFYAVPVDLLVNGIPEWVPVDAGILCVSRLHGMVRITKTRSAKSRHHTRSPDVVRQDLLDKIYYRYWTYAAPQSDMIIQ